MTTIAYKHESKEIACDSRLSSNGFIDTDRHFKKTVVDGVHWFFSGCEAHKDKFIADFERNMKTDFEFDCGAYSYSNGVLRYCCVDSGVFISWDINEDDAIGSGRNFAIAAMDFNCSAKDAVKYAMTRDSYTGGKINAYKLDKLK